MALSCSLITFQSSAVIIEIQEILLFWILLSRYLDILRKYRSEIFNDSDARRSKELLCSFCKLSLFGIAII